MQLGGERELLTSGLPGNAYATLEAALKSLQHDPDDASAAVLACRAYITLGLNGPARDLLNSSPLASIGGADCKALGERLAGMASGRVAWSSLQNQFDRNLAAAAESHPQLREHQDRLRVIPRNLELFRSADGEYHVSHKRQSHASRWVEGLHATETMMRSAVLPHDPKALMCGPYLVVGDRHGALFAKVFSATSNMFLTFTPRVYVLEEDLEAFGIGLYLAASVDALCHPRCQLFVGPDCVTRLAEYFSARPQLSAPEYVVRLNQAGDELANRAMDALQPRIEEQSLAASRTLATVGQYYESLPEGHWRQRFASDGQSPLRILGLTSRFTTYLQYSMRDWIAAFRDRGHDCRVLKEKNDHDLLTPARIAEEIADYKPDLIIIIDHLRMEYHPVIPPNVPMVCWIQDMLPNLTSVEAGRSQGPLDFIIALDCAAYVERYAYPGERAMPWTMATDARTFDCQPMSDEQLSPYRCDVSYVSSHSKMPAAFHKERRAMFAGQAEALVLVDELFTAVQASFKAKPRTASASLTHLLEDVEEATVGGSLHPETRKAVLNNYVYPLAELLFRQTALEWAADYCDRNNLSFKLYGNGWEQHSRFAAYANGFAHNGPQLRAIYQASKINLQIIGTGSLHQRLLDGLMAGGFFLIRYTPGDMFHKPAQSFLAAMRRYRPELQTEYPAAEMPEMAAAIQQEWDLRGLDRTCDRIKLNAVGVGVFEELEATNYSRIAGAVFPNYDDVSFSSRSEMESAIEAYLNDESARWRHAQEMRTIVGNNFTYGKLVDDLLSFVGRNLHQGAVGQAGQVAVQES